jgi:hypothetical protein
MRNGTAEERYSKKVDRSGGGDSCWPWTATRTRDGYGLLWLGGKFVRATRFGYALAFGPIPDDRNGNPLNVLHRCDNPPCCNPSHWFLGTPADNVADCVSKGRTASGPKQWTRRWPEKVHRGDDHQNAKLTEQQVHEIRDRYATGAITQTRLASEYGISQSNVSLIVRSEAWVHV